MPSTVNGIGTMYFGTWNRQVQDGVCESCHTRGKLISYETWHCICVLFIPLIPLGKKQVLNYCPSCTRHRVMPYREWVKIRDEALGETAEKMSTSPDDPDAAIQMHSTLAAFQKGNDAEKFAELMETKFADVARVQFYLGGWNERVGRGAIANRRFLRAFELAPDDVDIRRAAMLTFVEQGDVDTAKSLIDSFLPGTPQFHPALFYSLATGFQKQGRHQEAVQTLRMLLDASPGLKSDKTFRKTLLVSEKALGVEQLTIPPDPFYKSSAFRWLSAAAAVLAAIVGWNFHIAGNRTVTVVNGLTQAAISVKIDGGDAVTVGARGRKDVTLAEGRHEVEVVEPAGIQPKSTFVVSSGWWERFVRRPIFVIDPTRSAAVLWEEATYAARGLGGQAPENRYALRLGEPFTTYNHVDYPFQEFPAEIKLDKNSSRTVKTRVSILPNDAQDVVALAMGSGTSPASLVPFVETHLRAKPDDDNLLQMYAALSIQNGQTSRCREFLGQRLTDRPVRVLWHRWNQNLTGRGLEPAEARKEHEKLKQSYDEWLAKEPNDASLLYLRGRLEGHGRQSTPYFEKALASDPQHPYALYARSHQNLAAGEFDRALDLLQKAMAAKPNDLEFEHVLKGTRFAAGDLAGLEKDAREELKTSPLSTSAMETLLQVLVKTGRVDEADREVTQFSIKFRQQVPAQFHDRADQLQWEFVAMKGQFETLANQLANSSVPMNMRFHFFAMLETNQLADVPPGTQPEEARYWELCRSLVAHRLGDEASATAAREAALALFDRGNDDDWAVADVLRQDAAAKWEDVEDLAVTPQNKAVLLVTLARDNVELRSGMLDLAEKLNYDLEFPHDLIAKEIAELRAK